MLILLSSAKTMSGSSATKAAAATIPHFTREAQEIILQMTQYSSNELGKLLKVSPKLALENQNRFQQFHSEDCIPLQAILAYTGVVYKHINSKTFSDADFLFAQEHFRFVSACYGLLRPLDEIKPYRIEYDIKLPELGDGNMYIYWRDKQTQSLIDNIKDCGGLLINLASMDIQPSFHWKKVEEATRIITPEFKIWKNGVTTTIVIYTKMARGQMSRFIIDNRITDPELLKDFSWEGFRYNEKLSEGDRWVFMQD